MVTALGGGVHHHAREELEAISRPEKGCGDACDHFAGHAAPDLSQFGSHCPACHLRTIGFGIPGPGVFFFQHVQGPRDDRPHLCSTIFLVSLPTNRAPPMAQA
jgi:hypothetical protein